VVEKSSTEAKPANLSGKDYRDYVIKDGKLVGKFEEMYREAEQAPWHQNETAYAVFFNLDVEILKSWKEFLRIESILEVGCSLGYFTQRLKLEAGFEHVAGLDISETAAQKARDLFSEAGVNFFVGDIASPTFRCDRVFDIVM